MPKWSGATQVVLMEHGMVFFVYCRGAAHGTQPSFWQDDVNLAAPTPPGPFLVRANRGFRLRHQTFPVFPHTFDGLLAKKAHSEANGHLLIQYLPIPEAALKLEGDLLFLRLCSRSRRTV